ncbi:MAG TPA: hypothetical protein VEV37_04285 [Bryobacteraceae bacterium]|nr:hypothetical protein [Bryobacteraceae bacterium]
MTDRKGNDNMNPELKDMMQELQMALNESVCESERIAEILADIKSSGYDVLLALEVTIGMTAGKQEEAMPVAAPVAKVSGECDFSEADVQFLRGMHVGL